MDITEFSYSKTIKKVETKIIEFKKEIEEINLLNDQTTKNEHERKKFYDDLNDKVKICERIQNLHEYIIDYVNLKNFDSEISTILISKRNNILEQLDVVLKKNTMLTLEDSKNFNTFYSNLDQLESKIKLKELTINTKTSTIKMTLFQIVDNIKYKVENMEADQAAELLISMKIMAENIANFKKKIDEKLIQQSKILNQKMVNWEI